MTFSRSPRSLIKSLFTLVVLVTVFTIAAADLVPYENNKQESLEDTHIEIATLPAGSSSRISGIKLKPLNDNEECDAPAVKNSFSWADYLVLSVMLIVSCGIGLFYGFFGKKQTTSSDFLLGGSSMGTIPMSMSLAASFITAIELLGNPAEMYNFGSQFWMICIAFILIVPITSRLYLPVFMSLRLTSSYEYFALRFSPALRYLASGLYVLQMILYTSVAVYAPALALAHVTGLNVYIAVSVVYIVCIFYASQGGMKAVIIADSFQAAVLIGSILTILTLGEHFVGGTGVVWSTSYNTGRLEIFNLNPNPTIRHSFWSVVIGGTFYWLTMFCANQASIQKYLSVERLSQARTALWVSAFGLIFIYTANFYTGMIMLAEWKDCDPLRSGSIHASDQLLPLYVINILGHLKGICGLFVAGIFAASLGTVASALNSLAAVTTQDFISGALGIKLPESKGALYAKWISFIYGVISFGLVFVVEQLGSIMQVALSFNGMVGGVTLGLFSLGMFFPWANSRGALVGALTAIALVMTMSFGSQFKIASGEIVLETKPTSIKGCPCYNETWEQEPPPNHTEEVFVLFRVSYLWYSMIGCLVTVFIGTTLSFLTGPQDPKELDLDLLSPPVRRLFESPDEKNRKSVKTQVQKNIALTGVINIGLDVSDEKIQNEMIQKINTN